MGRPPLPVGTWGAVTVGPCPAGFRARTRFRDLDGVTRQVERVGRTKGAARSTLTAYLTARTTPAADAITGESLVRDVAAVWLSERTDLATNTRRRYREVIADHIAPAVGSLRVREATVTRLDRFVKNVTADVGSGTAKLCVSILSGVMALAVRHGAAATNPVRDVARVQVASTEVQAMTFAQVTTARAAVAAYVAGEPIVAGERVRRGRARADDLLDIVDVLLATGMRIGEALALRWPDVDLEAGTVTVSGTVIMSDTTPSRPTRQPFTKGRKVQTFLLPAFGVEAFMRRRVAMTHANVEDLVFPSQAGTVRDQGNVRKTLTATFARVDLGWVRPHTFRKTVATVIEREADLRTASAQMGHGSEAVTRRHYVAAATVGPDTRHIVGRFVPDASSGRGRPSR